MRAQVDVPLLVEDCLLAADTAFHGGFKLGRYTPQGFSQLAAGIVHNFTWEVEIV
jgi:hypothetical protein